MTIDDFIAKQKRRIEAMQKTDGPLFLAASSTHAMMVDRVFKEGKAADGSAIGKYDTVREMWINPNNPNMPRKFQAKGKHGDSTFSDGRPHKTGYFQNYKAFRQQQTGKAETVNLDLMGRLKSDFSNAIEKDNNNTWVARIKAPENQKKAIGNQHRFGKMIFGLTQEEREHFTLIAQQEFTRVFNDE